MPPPYDPRGGTGMWEVAREVSRPATPTSSSPLPAFGTVSVHVRFLKAISREGKDAFATYEVVSSEQGERWTNIVRWSDLTRMYEQLEAKHSNVRSCYITHHGAHKLM